MKRRKCILLLAMFMAVIALSFSTQAAKIKLNKKFVNVMQGKTVQLKVKGTKAKVKWSSENKKIATVNKKGLVKAKNVGVTRIFAKVGNKKLSCAIGVTEIPPSERYPSITVPEPEQPGHPDDSISLISE